MASNDNSHRLRIALVAPLWVSIPPTNYGGTELFLDLLAKGLLERDHEVTLFATGDSQTPARLQNVVERGIFEAMATGRAWEYEHYAASNLAEALSASPSFDVVHCHLGCTLVPFSILTRTPVVHTLHTPLSMDDRWVLQRYPNVPIVGISRYQIAELDSARKAATRIIYHGCDFGAYRPSFDAGSYLLFLARMGHQKSPLDAIRIAKAAGMPLVLAGRPQNAEEERYFRELIEPEIDGKAIRYVGSADHARKNELLRGAAALLFPIRGGEAFGLAMIEAMACGTPVLGFRMASVPEVIDYGETGFYADSVEEVASLVPSALALDRHRVYERAYARFNHTRMVDEYIALYDQLRATSQCTEAGGLGAGRLSPG